VKRRELLMEPELEALLNSRRVERRAPPEVRARVIARARAIVAAGGQIPPTASLVLAPPPSAIPPSRNRLGRIGVPASFAAAALVAIAAVAALRSRPAAVPQAAPSVPPTVTLAPRVEEPSTPPLVAPPLVAPPLVAPPLVAPPKAPLSARPHAELDTTELELLARAQSAYTHRDFGRAIALLGESSRRYPRGHLAEEREALRIRSLFGTGRTDEAQRAAAAFAQRFPRSVLLPKERKPSVDAR